MDQELNARWPARQPPFDGDLISLNDYLPIAQLRTLLVSVVAVLQRHYQAADLYWLRDWHEHDGFVLPRESTTWQSLDQLLASDQSLYDGRAGDYDVRLAYFPSDYSFLLRFYVMDEDEYPECPGRWGDFDLSGSPSLLEAVSAQLPEAIQQLLRREPSGAYFERRL